MAAVPLIVIDTNVWLDLFVFGDPAVQPLAQALTAGQVQAVRSAATDHELQRVLARPEFAARCAASAANPAVATLLTGEPSAGDDAATVLLQSWQRHAVTRDVPVSAPWRCTDADDQKFLDLAASCGAALLLSKDRALLRLAGPARRRRLAIVAPAALATALPGAASLGYC